MRVALVHDWLTGMRGGEKVLEAIAEIFPQSDLLTLLSVPGAVSPMLTTLPKKTSVLQKVPSIARRYRHFLPLMPWAIQRMDASGYDLIISSSHCVAKGIKKSPGAVHLSYVHAPMRYIWDRFDEYFGPGRASFAVRHAARLMRPSLQAWDRKVSQPERVDEIVANSQYIAQQVESAYERKAHVIYPFVEFERFTLPRRPGKNYLMLGAFAPYKRTDMAIEAFNRLKLPLLIVGSGQEEKRLKKMAGPTIDFLGNLSDDAVADLYSKCKAFVFPGIEDFGITPLEAMAAGAPVIALRRGGAAETVVDETGVFFEEPSVEGLMGAIRRFEAAPEFSEHACRARAAQFGRKRFQEEFVQLVKQAWKRAGKDPAVLEEKLSRSWVGADAPKPRSSEASPGLG